MRGPSAAKAKFFAICPWDSQQHGLAKRFLALERGQCSTNIDESTRDESTRTETVNGNGLIGRMAMKIRAMILAGLLGSTIFAGVAAAADTSNVPLVTAAK